MNDIKRRVLEYEAELLEDLAALVAIPSVRQPAGHPPFGTPIRQALDTFLAIGKRHGFVVQDFSGYACHIEYGRGSDYVGVLGHLDVVSAGDTTLWQTPPFQLTREGDLLFGRGVNDDKGPLLAALYALKIVKDMQVPLRHSIRIIAGGAEETTWECMAHYFQQNPQPIMGFSPDGNFPIVNGEKGILQYQVSFADEPSKQNNVVTSISCGEERNFVCDEVQVTVGQVDVDALLPYLSPEAQLERNGSEATVTYQGSRSLSRNPQRGENALWKLAKDLSNFPFAQSGMNEMLGYLNQYYTDDFYGKKLGIESVDKEMGSTSICPMSITQKPGWFQLNVDYRYHKSIHIESVVEQLKSQIAAPFTLLKQQDYLHVPKDSELLLSLAQAYQAVMLEEAEVLTKGGASYARVLENGVAFGATFEGEQPDPHMPNEKMPLSSLLRACEIYVHALINLAGKQ